ncbi:hypothetical protein MLD38_023657 [Melastoma candidum]|uniref:Uncharacterized protein n=1 Tax=Melastoma candidum TaxID=119954 RepID=A0ACB9NRL7_9MYRT|nr:hypothetical protein MLD38_023657 [Melastoma candidum]
MRHFALLTIFSLIISGLSAQPFSGNAVSRNYTSLVYKTCAKESLEESTRPRSQEVLSSLFDVLRSRSSNSTFFKAVAGDEDGGVSGRFQCRGDVPASECSACVSRVQELSRELCNGSVAAKIQLAGCHVRYEMDGAGVTGTAINGRAKYQAQHQKCGEGYGGGDSGVYEGKRSSAFEALESGVVAEGNTQGGGQQNGYYATDYSSFHVAAQCEGDLGPCDCGECVNEAIQIAQEECSTAMDGEIFMDRCSVSFHYYPEGQVGGGGIGGGGGNEEGNETGKEIAILVGGAAALGIGLLFLLLISSCCRKDDD